MEPYNGLYNDWRICPGEWCLQMCPGLARNKWCQAGARHPSGTGCICPAIDCTPFCCGLVTLHRFQQLIYKVLFVALDTQICSALSKSTPKWIIRFGTPARRRVGLATWDKAWTEDQTVQETHLNAIVPSTHALYAFAQIVHIWSSALHNFQNNNLSSGNVRQQKVPIWSNKTYSELLKGTLPFTTIPTKA